MIKWTAFPFLRFLAAFISGILFYVFLKPADDFLPTLIASMGAYLLVFIVSKIFTSTYAFKPFLGIAGLGILVLSGIQTARQHDMLNNQDHVSKYINEISYYTATVINDPEEKEKSFKTLVSIDRIRTTEGWKNSSGKIYLYIKRQNEHPLVYGDHMLIKGRPHLVPGPSNPEEFDYRKYLSFQNIYHQQFISGQDFRITGNDPPHLLVKYSGILRMDCDHIFKTYIRSPEEYKIATALVLGIRNNLDNAIKDAYANTGTMHILAVSGLHVAIIFQILSLLLGKIKKIRYGNYVLTVLLLILLWFYAFITGLSPSVLRAVTMFSFIIIAKALNRNTNIYNTLALSAFILSCYDPFFVMDVGFQLSYIAVAGIVYLHPRIYNSIPVFNPVLDKIWEVTSLSLAAQLATFPLCLLYFHQFPIYFLISNLLVIPVSFLVLYLGLALLSLAWFPPVAQACAWCLEKLIGFMNYLVLTIENFPYALINGVDINPLEAILIYSIVICLLIFMSVKKLWYLSLSLIMVIAFSSFQLFKASGRKEFSQMVVYNIKGHTAIGFLKGHKAELLLDSALLKQPSKIKFHIYGHLFKSGMEDIKISPIERSDSEIPHHDLKDACLFSYDGRVIMITGKNFKNGHYKDQRPDFLIARNNAIKDPEGAAKTIKCGSLIIDASNNSKYLKGSLSRMLYHNTVKEGAVILDF
jgi:competence protein ComEC